MKTKMIEALTLSLGLMVAPAFAFAQTNHTTGEKVDEAVQDTKKNAKKAVRKVKDETCHMVNGKMECAAKELKHKAQNAADEVKDKADDAQKSAE